MIWMPRSDESDEERQTKQYTERMKKGAPTVAAVVFWDLENRRLITAAVETSKWVTTDRERGKTH